MITRSKEISPRMATNLDCDTKCVNDEIIKQAIAKIWSFLKDFIPLANTHGAEFISHEHWDKLIPSSIQQELLALNEEELVNLPQGKFKTIPSECKDSHRTCNNSGCLQFEGSGTVHSKDSNHKSKGLNKSGINRSVSEWDDRSNISNASSTTCKYTSLNVFVSGAYECHIENLGILTSLEEAVSGQNARRSIIAEAMSEKKSHEVKVMSNTVSAMVKTCGADLVVDVGSGKGYLSLELANHQNIGVLGLDSCATNTYGAQVRKEKLASRWPGLVEKEDRNMKSDDSQWKKRVEYPETQKVNDNFAVKGIRPISDTKSVETSSLLHARTVDISSLSLAKTVEPFSLPDARTVKTSTTSHENAEEITHSPQAKTTDTSNLYVPLTVKVDPEMNLHHVIANHAAHLCRDVEKSDEIKFILSGLHTCGSLAVSTMRLFVKDVGAVGMCCVGCCYQLLDEQNGECEGDFPLSRYGKSLNLQLGRNARNLASQSVHRLLDSKQLQGKDFFWRALLDVLLRDLSLPIPERIMGMRKLNKQCKTFYEYAEKALRKLGLASDLVTVERVQALEEDHQYEQAKMAAFFQFKLIIAPVIESLILLDRLLFLIEQDCVRQAFLVKLFDPITSPRCYALVAYK